MKDLDKKDVLRLIKLVEQDDADIYGTAEEMAAVLQVDTRTSAEKELDLLLENRGAFEHGSDQYRVLRQITIELIQILEASGL